MTNITLEEFIRLKQRAYQQQRENYFPKLLEYRAAGKWKDFIDTALLVYEVMPDAFTYYDEVPDNLKYEFAISAYIHHGDSLPIVRKAVRGAAKYGKAELPPELQAQETITVYRAGEEELTKCKYRLSWTADINVALFFLNEYQHKHANHLFKGKIKTADIIAYVDDREEKEVIQYRKVFDIVEIKNPKGEIQ